MKGKLETLICWIILIAVIGTMYYFLAINPPHILNVIARFLFCLFGAAIFMILIYLKLKDMLKRFIKGVVRDVLKESEFEVRETHYGLRRENEIHIRILEDAAKDHI